MNVCAKRIKVFVVCCGVSFVLACAHAFADSESVNGITWTYYTVFNNVDGRYRAILGVLGGESSCTAVPTSTTGAVTIPSVLGGCPVKSIGSSAFSGCSGLTSVTIPDSVTSIEQCAFLGCSGLTSVTIPDGVTSIKDGTFYGCSGLTGVTIPDSVTSIGSSAFIGCKDALFDTTTIPGVKLVDGWAVGNTGSLSGSLDLTGVRGVGGHAFSDCSGLTSVTIGNGVTSIGNYAFFCCSGLTSVTIGSGVTSIWDCAFLVCRWLTSVTIPDSVTSIGGCAFEGCSGLTSVTIGNGVTSIGSSAFGGCKDALFDTTTIPGVKLVDGWAVENTGSLSGNLDLSGVRGIGGCAFEGCSGLTSVTIPDSVTSIGGGAFWGCSGLTSVTIGKGVTSIGEYAFYDCDNVTNLVASSVPSGLRHYKLANITIPNGVTNIENSAFSGCSGLTNVTIPDSVTSIGRYAFRYCSGLTSVTIPDRVTSIGGYAFSGCSDLTNVTIGSGVTRIGGYAFSGCSGLTNVTIGSGVTSIGSSAFYDCSGLTSVTIPDSVTSIGGYAFEGCSGLTNVTIGSGVTSIGDWAFRDCSGLTSVTIPNSVTNIGGYAFKNCSGLTSVAIPDGVTSIGYGAFSGCSGLTSITLPFIGSQRGNGGSEYSLFGHVFGTSSYSGGIQTRQRYSFDSYSTFYIPSSLREVVITDETQLGYGAFYGCSGLTSVTIPNSVTNIGQYAFKNCSGLTSVTIGDGVTSIEYGAFSGCSGLTNMTIPNSVTNIGGYAFSNCIGLTSVTIPDSVTSIGWSAFDGCSAIREVTVPQCVCAKSMLSVFPRAYNVITSVIISDSVTNIGQYAFKNCSGLASVTIPDSVTSIGEEAFYGCSGLTSVTIGDGVTSIGKYAFRGCRGLTSVTIPDGVTNIGEDAFIGCRRLEEIYAPSALRNQVRNAVDSNVKVYCGDVYVLLVLADGCEGMGTVSGNGAYSTGKNVTLKATPNRGYVFVEWRRENGERLSQEPSYSYRTGEEDVVFKAYFAPVGDDETSLKVNVADVAAEADGAIGTIRADGTRAFDLGACVESLSKPKITVTGLPTGLKFDAKTGFVSGAATKPGVYKVTVSATNATVKKAVTATFDIVVPNLTTPMFAEAGLVTDGKYELWAGVTPEDYGHAGRVTLPVAIKAIVDDGWALKAAGLPTGLKLVQDKNTKAYSITGVPTKAGTYTVTFTATKKGEKSEVATITLDVEAAPEWAVGTFTGWVDGGSLGSATMTVAANGKASGKIALEGTNWTFSASSYSRVDRVERVEGGVVTNFVVEAIAKAGRIEREIELTVSGHAGRVTLPNGVVTGTMGDDCDVKMWRNVWKDKSTAAAAKAEIANWEGVYTLSLDPGVDYGSGYLSLTVGKDGNVKATGKLADGTSASATSPLMYDEDNGWFAYLYAAPSAYKGGAFAAAVGFGGHAGRVTLPCGPALWTSRNPQATGEYGEGFMRDVAFTGAYYNKLDTLRKYYEELQFSADSPTLNGAGAIAGTSVGIAVDAQGKFVIDRDAGLTLSFAQATGIFKGGSTLVFDAKTKKKVSFEGIVVQGEDEMRGFYLWDASSSYNDPKTGKEKAYKYKQSFPVSLIAE